MMEAFKYFGYLCRQRVKGSTIPYFVFCARVKEVQKWVGIKRTINISKGHQRILRPARTKSIKHFLESDDINTIPNNILVAFDIDRAKFTSVESSIKECIEPGLLKNGCTDQMEWGFLEFVNDENAPEHEKAGFLVDGQHRLYGIASYAAENIPVLIVSLLGADPVEQAFQFIVVNNKQVKVPTDNIKSIIADFDEVQLEKRVLNAGIKYGDHSPLLKQINDMQESPFYHLLTWDYNRERDNDKELVPVTAIEQCLKFLQDTFDFLREDTDTLVDLFVTIWSTISNVFKELWNIEKNFMRKVNINALNELIAINLKGAWRSKFIDILDAFQVTNAVKAYFEDVPPAFWETKWTIKIQDNANVRKLIMLDIDRIKENVSLNNDWMTDLQLISEEASQEDE